MGSEAGRDRSKGTRAERRWQQGCGGAEGGDSRVEREGRLIEAGGEAAERSKGGGVGREEKKEKKKNKKLRYYKYLIFSMHLK